MPTITAIDLTEVLDRMTTVLATFYSMFGGILDTIVGNWLLALPVYFGIFGALVMFAIKIVRKFGVKSIGGGRRRRY